METDFKPGDLISFCDEEFVVVENYGTSGRVRILDEQGEISPFYWRYNGEECKLLRRAN